MEKTKKGFTLVELLVVIVILGILTTIGLFAFQSSQKKSRDSRRKSDLQEITKALELYNNDHGSYPGASSGKIAGCDINYTSACDWGSAFGNTTANVIYMIKLPKDPSSTKTKYVYEAYGKGYRLYAHLENGDDVDVPTTGQKYYNTDCSTSSTQIYCNYVITSLNVPSPTPAP